MPSKDSEQHGAKERQKALNRMMGSSIADPSVMELQAALHQWPASIAGTAAGGSLANTYTVAAASPGTYYSAKQVTGK